MHATTHLMRYTCPQRAPRTRESTCCSEAVNALTKNAATVSWNDSLLRAGNIRSSTCEGRLMTWLTTQK